MKIRKNYNVLVITGKDKGKRGKIRLVYTKSNKVLVEGVNLIKMHSRARAQVKQSGLIERESPINVSNVLLLCGKCDKPARIGLRVLGDGRKARFCRVCGEVVE